MLPAVLSKEDFVKRYAAGEFGNHAPTWDTLDDYIKSGYEGLVHIRNRVAGGPTFYNVPKEGAIAAWIEATNIQPGSFWYISAMAPTSQTLLQGEVQDGIWGLDLYYTQIAKPMREALTVGGKIASGLSAKVILQNFLCPRSWEWMLYLLEEYKDHVIEFSTYSVDWGTLPGYNTVFWEVRKY